MRFDNGINFELLFFSDVKLSSSVVMLVVVLSATINLDSSLSPSLLSAAVMAMLCKCDPVVVWIRRTFPAACKSRETFMLTRMVSHIKHSACIYLGATRMIMDV